MSGKRNVAVCRGHELANALYVSLTLCVFLVSMRWTIQEGHASCIWNIIIEEPHIIFKTILKLKGRLLLYNPYLHYIVTNFDNYLFDRLLAFCNRLPNECLH